MVTQGKWLKAQLVKELCAQTEEPYLVAAPKRHACRLEQLSPLPRAPEEQEVLITLLSKGRGRLATVLTERSEGNLRCQSLLQVAVTAAYTRLAQEFSGSLLSLRSASP